MRDARGNIIGTFGISRDITGRKRAEADIAERHRLATLVAEVGVVLTRAESLRLPQLASTQLTAQTK